jgi:carbon monoxide dehydrogenase subunit G
MDFSGSQKIVAPRERVFNALLDPAVLKGSIPGCESASYVDDPVEGRLMRLVVTTAIPGFKGPYDIFVKTKDVVAPSHLVLVTEPSSDLGSVKAACTIDLTDDAAGTNLNYNTHAELSGKIGAVPELVVKPAVKSAIDKFFSGFEKQVASK